MLNINACLRHFHNQCSFNLESFFRGFVEHANKLLNNSSFTHQNNIILLIIIQVYQRDCSSQITKHAITCSSDSSDIKREYLTSNRHLYLNTQSVNTNHKLFSKKSPLWPRHQWTSRTLQRFQRRTSKWEVNSTCADGILRHRQERLVATRRDPFYNR